MFHVVGARVIIVLIDGVDLIIVTVLLISGSSLSLRGVELSQSRYR
jgi:hypothetical protein